MFPRAPYDQTVMIRYDKIQSFKKVCQGNISESLDYVAIKVFGYNKNFSLEKHISINYFSIQNINYQSKNIMQCKKTQLIKFIAIVYNYEITD